MKNWILYGWLRKTNHIRGGSILAQKVGQFSEKINRKGYADLSVGTVLGFSFDITAGNMGESETIIGPGKHLGLGIQEGPCGKISGVSEHIGYSIGVPVTVVNPQVEGEIPHP